MQTTEIRETWTALYARLSLDDGNVGESMSIQSQKAILIGHKGSKLKKVGTEAREELERFLGKKVFLKLFVKVNENWRNDDRQLRRFGYLDA